MGILVSIAEALIGRASSSVTLIFADPGGPTGDGILLENGSDFLLTEGGDFLIQE